MTSREPILAHEFRVETEATGSLLSCRLRAPGVELPETFWYRVPPECAQTMAPHADAFVPPLVLAGMRAGRNVVIESDVSAALLASLGRVQRILHRWSQRHGPPLVIVDVSASAASRSRRGMASGAFFSLGVDSFYTVLKNVRRYPPGDSRAISHLVLVHGFDITLSQTALFDMVREQAREASAALGKVLLSVATNAREVVKAVDWGYYGCGPAMAGVGLALAGLHHTLYIGASDTYEKLSPWGSHPALDPLWSTEGLEFVYDGGEAERFDKIGVIASSPMAVQKLRVCWENRGAAYNCGRCEKCLRTMIALELWGALAGAQFPQPIDPADIARLPLSAAVRPWWREMIQEGRRARIDLALIAAMEKAMQASAWSDSPLGRVDHGLASALARLGLSPARLKRADATWLRGLGAAALRWLQRRATRGR